MNFVDHAKGHTPAKKGDHARYDVTLYHNACGKPVSYDGWRGYTCAGPCKGGWHPDVIRGFSDDAMATRFHVRTRPDLEEYVFVEKADEFSKRAYTAIVPRAEAHQHKKAIK